MLKRPPKRHPKSLKIRPPRPRAAQRPPGTPPEASREPFWHHFGPPGAHFRAFQASFSKLARAPPHDRKHCSKSLPKGSFATAAGQMRKTPKAQWPVWGRRPTGDPATGPSGSLEAVSEARCRSRKHCDKHSFGNPASTVGRLPKSPLPLGPPSCSRPMRLLLQKSLKNASNFSVLS